MVSTGVARAIGTSNHSRPPAPPDVEVGDEYAEEGPPANGAGPSGPVSGGGGRGSWTRGS